MVIISTLKAQRTSLKKLFIPVDFDYFFQVRYKQAESLLRSVPLELFAQPTKGGGSTQTRLVFIHLFEKIRIFTLHTRSD